MDYTKLYRNICRICLEHNSILNWNVELCQSSGVSYRDCYYKYTQMEEIDEESYPTYLCGNCADGVRNAHELFENALKSFIILQNTANVNYNESFTIESCNKLGESSFAEQCKNGKTEIDIDEVICYSPLQEDNIAETEADFSIKEMTTTWNKIVPNFSSLCEATEENAGLDKFNIKLLSEIVDKKQIKKRRYLEALNTALELKLQLEISDKKILKSLVDGNAKKNVKPAQNLQSLDNDQIEVRGQSTTVTADEVTHLRRKQTKRNTRLSRHISTKEKSTESSDSQKFYSKNNVDKNELIPTTTNSPWSMSNNENIDKNFHVNSNPKLVFEKSKPEECDFGNRDGSDANVSCPEETNILLETDRDTDKKSQSYKPLEIALLEKIYGKDFDMESIKQNNKPTKRSKGRPKICQYCSMVVFGKRKILVHEATHLQRERNEVCPTCGLKFFTKDSLNMHVKIHDENREKSHKCAYCEKAFYHAGARNVHQRIHLGLMVKCPMCPKEFYRQVDVDKHLSSHSVSKLNNGARRIKHKVHCQYCNKYIMTNTWKAHKAAHLKEPQVKCKICDREFYARDACVKHLRKKHGETGAYQQYIHAYNKNRMSHLMIKQQEAVEMVIE